MFAWNVLIGTIAYLTAVSPVHFDNTSPTVRSLRGSGFKLEGRDPCDGTGLCCALLPANIDSEVYYVTLPNKGWDLDDLRLLNRFTNLKHIRAGREISKVEYDTLRKLIRTEDCLLFNVRNDDGSQMWTGPSPSTGR